MSRQEWYNQLYMILSEWELKEANLYEIKLEDYRQYSPIDAAEMIRVDIYECTESYARAYGVKV